MSAPQDIQSILAALAQQVPIAAPASTAAAPSAPASTVAAAPQQKPAYSAAPSFSGMPGFGPPPSAPAGPAATINSASLSDAIAQAKAFAAQKGVSQDFRSAPPPPPPPPMDQRPDSAHPYSNRSRSRSPVARREPYRENYNNPYRDERREERSYNRNYSGQDLGRPRSGPARRSPNRGGPATDDGSTFEIFEVNANLVGLVIGRSGENLRRIENESGCRVQFLGTSDSGQRECKITGPKPRREEVKAAIEQTIADSGALGIPRIKPRTVAGPGAPAPVGAREGEDHMQIMVPDRTVGLIIGRKGETISDLQERSGCHINIVDETKSVDGLRPVNLIGTPEQTQRAKDMIMQIVDSDSRDANGGAPGAPAGPGMGAPSGPGPMSKKPYGRDNFGGPRESAGPYGGHRGNSSGDTYGIPVPTGPDVITDEMYVPSEAVGMIIGKKGETIREIQANSGCKINITQGAPNGDDSQRSIGLIGTPDAIRQAKGAISDRIDAMRQRQATSGPYMGGSRRDDNDYEARGRGPRDSGYAPRGAGPSSGHAGAYGGASRGQAEQSAGGARPAAGDADPYAQYGGYNNYVALWYQQWMSQAASGQTQGQAPPPGQPSIPNPPQ
ncbi:hypothetical protein TD95_003755 [Thielaviopsis punctulata]|uniref:K Homology domain-containing protein n=1 Tax=Thielaviopsis punctulata TaxID=72032 RepID=A0A0F4Z8L0_9PEZI|nr:hypothetical protein TD95_003755 [Thielaviopsis punctulata]